MPTASSTETLHRTGNKIFWALPAVLSLIILVLATAHPAEGNVQVTPQSVRVGIAQMINDSSFTVHGKYRLIDNYSGDVVGVPREGEVWQVKPSANGINVWADNKPVGSFVGPLSLKAEKHRVHIMSGNGSLIQKDAAELAVQSAAGSVSYLDDGLDELWAQGENITAALSPAGVMNLSEIRIGTRQPFRAYRGDFEFRRTGDGLLVINQLGIEEYLYGVVPAEIQSQFPAEAIKAQAVAARSYLISNLGNYSSHGFDILSTQNSQIYKGYEAEDPRTSRAIDATRGEVLIFRGRPIPAFFHASSGGYTENSEDIWSAALPYIRTKADPLDSGGGNKHYNWQVTYSHQQLINQLSAQGYQFQTVADLKVLAMTASSKRVKAMRITGTGEDGSPKVVDVKNANNVRGALGLKSALFDIEKNVDQTGHLKEITITGDGWGHGLGLSQWGARGMAEKGYNYREILQYYYTGVSIAGDYGL